MISFGECFTYVLLWSFMVSCLIFKALSHFEFIFVYGVRICSKFIDLHPALQLSQSPLADKTIFSHILLPPLLKINWLKGLGFISGPSILFHWSICLFFANTILFWLLQLCSTEKSGRFMSPALFFSLRIDLAILGLLWFHINFRIICTSSMKKVMSNFIAITLNL